MEAPPKITEALVREYLRSFSAEAASHLNRLEAAEVRPIFLAEPVSVQRDLLLHLSPGPAARLLEQLDESSFAKLFARLDPGRALPILARLADDVLEERLSQLPTGLAQEYRELLSYPQNTAGSLMDPKVAAFHPHETVKHVLDRIRKARDRRILDVCVVDDEGRLTGVVPLQHVAVAEPTQQVQDLIEGEPIAATSMDPREDIVALFEQRKLASLPVVDSERRLLGIIRYGALVEAAQEEMSSDLQSMFGAGKDERALSSVAFAVRKRLPWLEINLATAFLAATVVGLFEGTIAKFTALAVFLPVVAGQSGNTGSQALAVTMRGLALREIRTRHWLRVAGKEVGAGLLNGIVVAATTSLVVYIWMSSAGLAAVIGVAMVFSMILAGLSGAVIPIALQALGQDPAQSSSIVLTTVTDIVGFLSFLGLATLFSAFLVAG
jgi:magnesium transporter